MRIDHEYIVTGTYRISIYAPSINEAEDELDDILRNIKDIDFEIDNIERAEFDYEQDREI